jgi:hypothetical protein
MPGKQHYHVQIRRNGAVYGTFGPYAKKADALADAGSLGGPGLSVAVEGCTSCAAGTAPAKRRNTSKAEDGLKRRLATYDRKVAAIRSDDDVLAAVRYLDKVISWAYENGVGLDAATERELRASAFNAGESAGRSRRAAREQEIRRLRDEKRAAEKPYDWMRRNAPVKVGSRWKLSKPISLRVRNRLYFFREGDFVYVDKVEENGEIVHLVHDDVPFVARISADRLRQSASPAPRRNRSTSKRRNAATSHRGVRIQRKAGVARFTHPLTGERVSVAQRDGGLKGAKALIDAALDRQPVRRVANPGARQNHPAVAAALRVAAPYLIDVAAKMGRKRLQGFAKLSRPEQIKAIRRHFRFSLPVRALLVSDAAAGAVADALVGLVESGGADAAISAAAKTATKAARSNPSNLPPKLARR